MRLDRILTHKPARVIEERVQRHRFDLLGGDSAVYEVRIKRCHFTRVELPIGTRTQKHSARHIRFPKVKRLADDDYIHSQIFRIGGGGDAIRPRADDEERGMIHGKTFPSLRAPATANGNWIGSVSRL